MKTKHRCTVFRLECMAAASALLLPAMSLGHSNTEPVSQVLNRYPSPAKLGAEIAERRSSDPESFQAALLDIDVAIRHLHTRRASNPPDRGASTPHVPDRPTLYAIWTRKERERQIAFLKEERADPSKIEYLRDNLQAMTIDDSPQLVPALQHILLQGWQEWEEWDRPELVKIRQAFPDAHRVYALRELRRLKVVDICGVLFGIIADPQTPRYMFAEASDALRDLADSGDRLEFLVDTAFSAAHPTVRERLQRELPVWAADARKQGKASVILQPFIDGKITLLRLEARCDGPSGIPELIQRWEQHEQWVAENDPDPTRREEMAHVIRRREILCKRQEGTLTPEEWEHWRRESRAP